MTDACPAPKCAPVIKRNYFVRINGSAFSNVVDSADCSRGLLLLTDDAGLIDVDDAGLGAFLGDGERFKIITSFSEAATHWSVVSSTYRDLQCFFNLPAGRGSRPPFIYVGFVDRAVGLETLTQGFQEVIKCPTCFWTVVPTQFQTDGVDYVDTVEMRDLQSFIRTDKEYDIKVPTFEASLLFASVFETASQAAVAAAAGSDAEYIISSYYCDVQREADGTAFVNPADPDPDNNPAYPDGANIPEFRYSNDALLIGAVASSYSVVNDSNYNWTEFLKPYNFGSSSCATGRFLDETTRAQSPQPDAISVDEAEVINATGVNGLTGEVVPGASRHANLFVNTQNGITYVESLRVNGSQFADVWYKERAINDALRESVLLFMASRHALGLSENEQRLLAAVIGLVLQRFVDKQVINPVSYPWAENGYDNILIERPGYVVTVRPISDLTAAQITQRNGYVVGVCFIVNEPQHRVGINICETIVDTSLIGG